jgi:hypothetical protein
MVKPDINSVEVHPHLTHYKHPLDGVLVGAGSLFHPDCASQSVTSKRHFSQTI